MTREEALKQLGLEHDSDALSIKKTYFSMIRKFPPEKDPEQFKKIREAYEILQKPEKDPAQNLPEPKEPFAKKMLAALLEAENCDDFQYAAEIAAEAFHKFPSEDIFLYYMASNWRRAGFPGKAVKACEQLVKKYPDTPAYLREMALCYEERGYSKKAAAAFEKAMNAGCNDLDFLLSYSAACHAGGKFDKTADILHKVITGHPHPAKEDVPLIFDAWGGIISTALHSGKNDPFISEHYEILRDFFRDNILYINAGPTILASFFITLGHIWPSDDTERLMALLKEILPRALPDISEELLREIENSFSQSKLFADPRLSEFTKDACGFIDSAKEEDMEDLSNFLRLDLMVSFLERGKEILPELEIIKKEYPEYFTFLREVYELLKSGRNLDYYKSRYMKDYERKYKYFDSGLFKMYFPDKISAKTRLAAESYADFDTYEALDYHISPEELWDKPFDEPFVRGGKKIGRNNPCPCGSGKKYKHCCGRGK